MHKTDLIGVEIGRYSVCASILDYTGNQLLGYADSSILSAEITYGGDSRFPNPGPAITALWTKLGLDESENLRVAVTIGVGHSGIGSGPAIEQWVDSLAVKISDPITKAGDPNTGVSYVPTRHLATVLGIFKSLGVSPERIELPPVAVERTISPTDDYSVSVSSGIGWKARVHQGQVLEAVAYPDGLGKEGIHVETSGRDEAALAQLHAVQIPSSLFSDDRISMAALAVSVGAAKGLLRPTGGNFVPAYGGNSFPPSRLGVEGSIALPSKTAAMQTVGDSVVAGSSGAPVNGAMVASELNGRPLKATPPPPPGATDHGTATWHVSGDRPLPPVAVGHSGSGEGSSPITTFGGGGRARSGPTAAGSVNPSAVQAMSTSSNLGDVATELSAAGQLDRQVIPGSQFSPEPGGDSSTEVASTLFNGKRRSILPGLVFALAVVGVLLLLALLLA